MDPKTQQLNAMCRRHKSALTRALKSGDPRKARSAAQAALDDFEATGLWPDHWRLWQNAKDDADWMIARQPQVA